MTRAISLYLEDIASAINKIEKYTKGIPFDRLKRDEKTIDAVIRNNKDIPGLKRKIKHIKI